MKCQKCGKPTRINWGSGELVLCNTHQDCEAEFDTAVKHLRHDRLKRYSENQAWKRNLSISEQQMIYGAFKRDFSLSCSVLIALQGFWLSVVSLNPYLLVFSLGLGGLFFFRDVRKFLLCKVIFKTSFCCSVLGSIFVVVFSFFDEPGSVILLITFSFIWMIVVIAKSDDIVKELYAERVELVRLQDNNN